MSPTRHFSSVSLGLLRSYLRAFRDSPTEKDLKGNESFFLDFGNEAAVWRCRDTGESRHRGGVLILIGFWVPFLRLPGADFPNPPVGACTLTVYPADCSEDGLRVTGLYSLPPFPRPTHTIGRYGSVDSNGRFSRF